jgi:hypothetical protein
MNIKRIKKGTVLSNHREVDIYKGQWIEFPFSVRGCIHDFNSMDAAKNYIDIVADGQSEMWKIDNRQITMVYN